MGAESAARAMRVSKPTFLRALREAGIPRRRPGAPPVPKLEDPVWLRARYAKRSANQIAYELRCSEPAVLAALARHKIRRRTRPEAQLFRARQTGYRNPNKGRRFGKAFRERVSRAKKGWTPPPGWSERQSRAQKGRKKTAAHQAKINAALRKPEVRAKISAAGRGSKHYNWKGGTSFLPHPPEFTRELRDRVRKRDGFQCRMPGCGATQKQLGRRLDVHHVDYDKKNNQPSNLISLCMPCHRRTNYRRGQWLALLRPLTSSR